MAEILSAQSRPSCFKYAAITLSIKVKLQWSSRMRGTVFFIHLMNAAFCAIKQNIIHCFLSKNENFIKPLTLCLPIIAGDLKNFIESHAWTEIIPTFLESL